MLGFVGVDGIGYADRERVQVIDYRRGMALAARGPGAVRRRRTAFGRDPPRVAARHGGAHRRPAAPMNRGDQISPPWTSRRLRGLAYAVVTRGDRAAVGRGCRPEPDAASSVRCARSPAPQACSGRRRPAGIFTTLLADLWLTVQIALGATLIGTVLALPIGALAARNVAPTPRVARAFRMLVVLIRGIPELVLAVVFVVITGLGAVAGTLALAVGVGRAARQAGRRLPRGGRPGSRAGSPRDGRRPRAGVRRRHLAAGRACGASGTCSISSTSTSARRRCSASWVPAASDSICSARRRSSNSVWSQRSCCWWPATVLAVEALAVWLRHELR